MRRIKLLRKEGAFSSMDALGELAGVQAKSARRWMERDGPAPDLAQLLAISSKLASEEEGPISLDWLVGRDVPRHLGGRTQEGVDALAVRRLFRDRLLAELHRRGTVQSGNPWAALALAHIEVRSMRFLSRLARTAFRQLHARLSEKLSIVYSYGNPNNPPGIMRTPVIDALGGAVTITSDGVRALSDAVDPDALQGHAREMREKELEIASAMWKLNVWRRWQAMTKEPPNASGNASGDK